MCFLVALNWDYLTEGTTEGILVLITTALLTLGTLVFYFLTGCTDPGFVRNQIFENQYETTEYLEDDEQNKSQGFSAGVASGPSNSLTKQNRGTSRNSPLK